MLLVIINIIHVIAMIIITVIVTIIVVVAKKLRVFEVILSGFPVFNTTDPIAVGQQQLDLMAHC